MPGQLDPELKLDKLGTAVVVAVVVSEVVCEMLGLVNEKTFT